MGESLHVPDLGHEHRRMPPTDPVEVLNGSIPDIIFELLMDAGLELTDLSVIDPNQVPQGGHPVLVGVTQAGLIQEPVAGRSPHLHRCGITPSLRNIACTCPFNPARS